MKDMEPMRLVTDTLSIRDHRAYSIVEAASLTSRRITNSEVKLLVLLADYLKKKIYILKYEVMIYPGDKPEDVLACLGRFTQA